MENRHQIKRPRPNPIGDLIISDTRLGVGTTENLSTLTVHARDTFNLTGTLAKTAASAIVTGTGTLFLSELSVGDRITVGTSFDATKAVIDIASDTSLTVESNYEDTEAGLTVQAFPSAARFDDCFSTPQTVIDDKGNVGIGTMGPQAQLHVLGVGASALFGGCPSLIQAHASSGGDAWNLVLSYGSTVGTPGVAMWVDDIDGTGWPTLSYTLFDGVNTMVDVCRMDVNGLHVPTEFRITPQIVSIDYQITSGDQYVYVDASGASHTATLPNCDANTGRVLYIFKADGSGNTVTVAPASGDSINGSTSSKTITAPYDGIKLVALPSSRGWVATALPAA